MKELEIEKRTLKSRLEQVEGDLYKAKKEAQEAIKAKEGLESEVRALKKAKDDADKALSE